MNNLWVIFKTTFFDNYNINGWFKKDAKSKFKGIATLVISILIYLYLVFAVGLYANSGFEFLLKYGMQNILISIFGILSIVSMFILTVNKSKSGLFNSNDNDLLFSMPITPKTILASRVINLLIMNYFTVIIFFVPMLVIYFLKVKLGFEQYVFSILSVIFLPMIPSVLASLVGYIIAYISSKLQRKTIIETIITFIFTLGIVVIFSNMENTVKLFMSNIDKYDHFLKTIGLPIYHMQLAITEGSYKSMAIYILINLFAFGVFVLLISSSYKKIIAKLQESRVVGKYKLKGLVKLSTWRTLFQKELRMYFSTPIYILNTAFGLVMIFFAAILSLFYDKNFILNSLELQNMAFDIFPILILMMAFVISTVNITASSISLEGNNIWIIKSMPIDEKQIFKSKILLNLFIIIPILVIALSIFSITFKITITKLLLTIIFVIMYSWVIAQFGLITNLKYPKLKFKSATQVVKQSLSTFISLIAGFGAVGIAMYTFNKLQNEITFNEYYCIIILLLGIISFIQKKILNNWGVKRFKQIN